MKDTEKTKEQLIEELAELRSWVGEEKAVEAKREQAEEALRESEERFRVALMHSPVVVFSQDRELRYTWIHNPHPGFSDEEVLGKTDAELLPSEDSSHLVQLKQSVLESGKGAREEIRIMIDGEEFFYDLAIEPLRDKIGHTVGVTCAAWDITERKQAEDALSYRLQVEKLTSTISASFVSAEGAEIDETLTSALEEIARFTGADRSSLFLLSDDQKTITNTHEWCTSPEDSQIALLQEILFSTFGYHREELHQHRPISISRLEDFPPMAKGEREWMEEHGFRSLLFVPLLKQGKLHGTLGFYGGIGDEITWPSEFVDMLRTIGDLILNILERKQAKEELQKKEHWWNLFSVATSNMLWNWNFEDNSVERNVSFETAFGYSNEEITPIISWWVDRLHDEDRDRVMAVFQRTLDGGDDTCSYDLCTRQ